MSVTVAGATGAELAALVPPLATGLVAGLAVAVPLGAIGVLLLHEGMARGTRAALAGAAGIASVDAAFATIAVVGGAWTSAALAGRETAVRLVGAAVLGVIAVRGLLGAVRQPRATSGWAGGDTPFTGTGARPGARQGARPGARPGLETGAGTDAETGTRAAPRPLAGDIAVAPVAPGHVRVYARFVALTAINPLTAAAFAVLAAGLAQRWSTSADRGAFVVGVTVASLAWQSVLAIAGGLLGARVRARSDDRLRRVLGVGGFGLVGVLAVALAVG